ncbi:MAG: dTDP-4-amino-4,6-dideoxygalactose transaminase [Anaerolineae bacterium]|nr:dTDP-4-amino-4,6-dideoxygalactose transaminase [Chloroflexi bacterium CFX1]MCQ3946710.1 dTDP-4-amino-4,6-dideoxygalactose transaminase [Anaerolineae bacterium]RIK28004.1 MAG: dTDP-4-amino-4,6-dideoxygalactose transaminase [Anaerolineae bacterium]
MNIPFNRAVIAGREMEYIAQAITAGHISGDGTFTKKTHALLEGALGVPKALLTTSCTHALEMMAILLDIQPGDEVIIPDFTFVSTVNAFVLRGARPVFLDVRPDTLNLDESLLEAAITSRTRAIVVVHYAGVGCEMDSILKIANRHGIPVVEDNAHGLFGKYKGKFLGTFGAMASQSFHETKNFTCGEGGALLINDPRFIERAEIIREKGTNRSRFFRGQVDKYTWVDIGSSYLPSEILAAFLYGQLEQREKIQSHRRRVWETYHSGLEGWAASHDVRLPVIPEHCEQAYHMYYMLLPSLDARQKLIQHLKENGILSVFHYLPLHLSDMGQKFGGKPGDCPVTEEISDQLVRLPFYNDLTLEEQQKVIDAILGFSFSK